LMLDSFYSIEEPWFQAEKSTPSYEELDQKPWSGSQEVLLGTCVGINTSPDDQPWLLLPAPTVVEGRGE
jgi:hypothetical protein